LQESIREKLNNIIRIPKDISDLKDVLDLDIKYFKRIDEKVARTLAAVLGVSKIKDFIKVNIDESKILTLKVLGITPTDLFIWRFIARVIDENKVSEFFGSRKAIICGLDNAGKTAILHILQNKLNLDMFGALTATIGANRAFIDNLKYGMTYNILDLGGQEEYRKEYIQNAEKYFIGVEYLMYVIDAQDPENLEKSLKYFQEILEILELLKETPELMIILNKVDPDLRDDQEIIETCEFLENQINSILINKGFHYEITRYSIYKTLGNNEAIIRGIRDLLTGRTGLEVSDTSIGNSLEHILNIIINMASEIETRFIQLEKTNQNIYEWIDFLRKSVPEKRVEHDSLEFFRGGRLEEEKQLLKNTLQKELKNILKIRESDQY